MNSDAGCVEKARGSSKYMNSKRNLFIKTESKEDSLSTVVVIFVLKGLKSMSFLFLALKTGSFIDCNNVDEKVNLIKIRDKKKKKKRLSIHN